MLNRGTLSPRKPRRSQPLTHTQGDNFRNGGPCGTWQGANWLTGTTGVIILENSKPFISLKIASLKECQGSDTMRLSLPWGCWVNQTSRSFKLGLKSSTLCIDLNVIKKKKKEKVQPSGTCGLKACFWYDICDDCQHWDFVFWTASTIHWITMPQMNAVSEWAPPRREGQGRVNRHLQSWGLIV